MDSRDIYLPNYDTDHAGAVYHQTRNHLQDRVEMKPDPEPTSVTDTPNVSNKDQTHVL